MPGSESSSLPDDEDARDRSWMAAAATGDQEAYARLIVEHQKAIYGFIVRMLGHPDGAEDLVQDTFVRLWRAAPSWRPESTVRGYLFLIARRVVYNECRRRKRKPFTSVEKLAQERVHGLDLPDPRPDAASHLDRRELWQRIDAAIAELPEAQRAAVILRRYEESSYEEIAANLEISVASVKSLLWRARQTLRSQLEAWL